MGFPDSSVGKESACNAGDPSSIPGLGRSPGEGTVLAWRIPWTVCSPWGHKELDRTEWLSLSKWICEHNKKMIRSRKLGPRKGSWAPRQHMCALGWGWSWAGWVLTWVSPSWVTRLVSLSASWELRESQDLMGTSLPNSDPRNLLIIEWRRDSPCPKCYTDLVRLHDVQCMWGDRMDEGLEGLEAKPESRISDQKLGHWD